MSVVYLGGMESRSPHTQKAGSRKRRQADLLGVWLDLFNQLDNPLRRRAAKFRQTQRPRRGLPKQRLPWTGASSRRRFLAEDHGELNDPS